jgi:hypothetical protein
MTDKTNETGKGPYRPGDPPRRPHATIDVEATAAGRERGAADAPGASRSDLATRLGAGAAAALAAVWSLGLRLARNSSFVSHAAAGVAGAALILAVGGALGLMDRGQGGGVPPDLVRRLAAVETALAQRPALPGDLAAKLTGAQARLARLEERFEAAQAKHAADAKALEARVSSPDMAERIGKLEAATASLSGEGKPGTARLADMEKLAGEASDAKAASVRVDQEVVQLKSEAQSLRQSLEAVKGSIEEQLKGAARAADIAPVTARVAALERDLHGVLKTEGARTAGAQQVLLALEIASLKRAVDRGDSYVRELDAVRRTASGSIDLAPLERDSRSGVPTLGVLTQDFRHVANAALDAEREQADASVLDRLMSGARSIVRWRKASYDADDASVEAILSRMENALKDGHLGEAQAQGRRLPPKAARAAAGWLRKLEARTSADRAVADIEAGLKASLAGGRAPEGTR